MRIISHTRVHRAARGFTLVELLTVVMIIMLLVSILLPALAGARIAVMRERCKHNTKELARVCIAYATESSYHRGNSMANLPCLANALPNTLQNTTANWAEGTCTATTMPKGNIGAFWQLYKMNYVGPEHMFCLESEQQRETRPLIETDTTGFKGVAPDNTACYSYLAQAWNSTESGSSVLKYGVSMVDTPAYVVIVADWNPGVTVNVGAAASTDNSLNHKKEGQNFARMDGSAEWTEKRTVWVKIVNGQPREDDIYVNYGNSAAGPRQEYTFNGVALLATDDFLLH